MRNVSGLVGRKFLAMLAFGISAGVCAQQVPKDLPGEDALNAYQSYLERPDYKAFAVSREGGFGAAWSYGLISAAENAAIDACQEQLPEGDCFVVSIDGKSIQQSLDVDEFKAHLAQQRTKTWPEIEANDVPIQIARHEEATVQYQQYLSETGFKAFASSPQGAFAWVAGQVNSEQAKLKAVQACELNGDNGRCSVIDTNHQATLGRVKVNIASGNREMPAPQRPPMPDSDERTKLLAQRYFNGRWEEYQQVPRNKAFAVNNFGAMGMASEHNTTLSAEEAALSTCESYNAVRKNTPRLQYKVAPCFVIATNNFYDRENIQKVANQKAMLSNTPNIPEK